MAQKKRGRPPLPDGEAKTERLELRLTADERNALQRIAEHDGRSAAEVIRALVMRRAKRLGLG